MREGTARGTHGDSPAFPLAYQHKDDLSGAMHMGLIYGLTKRELIAAMLLQGLVSRMTEARFLALHDGIAGGQREVFVAKLLADALIVGLSREPSDGK